MKQLYEEIHFCLNYMTMWGGEIFVSLANKLKFSIYEDNFFNFFLYTEGVISLEDTMRFYAQEELSPNVYPSYLKPFFQENIFDLPLRRPKDLIEVSRFLTYEIWGYKDRCNMHISKETLILMESFIYNIGNPPTIAHHFPEGTSFPLLRAFFKYRNPELNTPINLVPYINELYHRIDYNIFPRYYDYCFNYKSYKYSLLAYL